MIINPNIQLHRLVLSLSEALDYVHPQVVDHQHRVAYIALQMARTMDFPKSEIIDLFHAAAFHDIGLIGVENRIRTIHLGDLESVGHHPRLGYELLHDNHLFATSAESILYHHIAWNDGRGQQYEGHLVPFNSHILALADFVDRMIDRSLPILSQTRHLKELVCSSVPKQFHPVCADAFHQVSANEAFWLDIASEQIYSVILNLIDWPALLIDKNSLGLIAKIFARIVDASSPWTAVHSAGVTASAVALARLLNFSPREADMVRAAGYFHDLGKLSVPASILDKPGKLNEQETSVMRGHTYHTFRILNTIGHMPLIIEWAAFHHERLDAKGYPFRHSAADLTLGSRIMAVADVFSAITEDRPYREGMSREKSLQVLENFVADGGLDGDVVNVLTKNFADINEKRHHEQNEYFDRQKKLLAYLHQSNHKKHEAQPV